MSRVQRELGTNGHSLPMDWQGVPDDVIQRMELAYQEIQRRDSQAEQRAWRKDRSCNGSVWSLWSWSASSSGWS